MSNATFSGVIIEESLEDKSILSQCRILRTEVVPVSETSKTPWIAQWTMHTVEIEEEMAGAFAEAVSRALDSEHAHAWYGDFRNDIRHYIIFRNKVFLVDRAQRSQYEPVKEHGMSLGIPDYQLDF